MSDPRLLQNGFEARLADLVEECGGVLAAAGKTQRWGPLAVNPVLPARRQETNIAWLRREMKDLKLAIYRLELTISDLAP